MIIYWDNIPVLIGGIVLGWLITYWYYANSKKNEVKK